ncbi:MAG: transposase [Chloroflexota bacterium]|nr:transposase [Chloroflexota bacterium]
MLEHIDLHAIEDENARTLIQELLNLVEDLAGDLRDAREEVQKLRDEVNRLKGEQGKPDVKGKTRKKGTKPHSSERERWEPRKRQKRSKKAELQVDREEVLRVDPQTLPADAKFKGYAEVVVPDLVVKTDNVRFKKEKYYAASTGKTYLGALPVGYQGQFGPGIKALVWVQYYGQGVSEPKIHEFLKQAGIEISTGQVSNMLIHNQEQFHAEKAEVYEAGLRSSPWQQIDDTLTRVNGENQSCHVVCNPVYAAYFTRPRKDRLTVLDVLRHGRARQYCVNTKTLALLEHINMARKTRRCVEGWQSPEMLDAETFIARLDAAWPQITKRQRTWIITAAAIAAYHADSSPPVVHTLLCDDAPQFEWLTEDRMLCWVHAGRPYKKLRPLVAVQRTLVDEFLTKFWDYYRRLRAYQRDPSPAERVRLDADFDSLFATRTGCHKLDRRIAKTQAKKATLLVVLDHPELPLHNNAAELAVRHRVRKRDVSFGPRTPAGKEAWDTFMTLAATANKVGISFFAYLQDRIRGTHTIPPLAELVTLAAQSLQLADSWVSP